MTDTIPIDPIDPWRHWQDNLIGRRVPLHEGTPNAGFYRTGQKSIRLGRDEDRYPYSKLIPPFTPVAYWPSPNGELFCRIGDDDVHPMVGRDLWVAVCNHPVDEQNYRNKAEQNKPWADEHELLPMGHNKPPEEDTLEGIRDKIEPLIADAKKRLDGPAIANDNEYSKAEDLSRKLGALAKRAEELRDAEKKPHSDELKAIQAKWAPIIDEAEIYKNIKYKLLTPWDIARKKAQEAEAEAAAAAGEPAPETRRRRSATGRTMSLRTFKSAEIIDYEACLNFFKDSPDVKATIQDLANKMIRTGMPVPGTKLIEEQRTV